MHWSINGDLLWKLFIAIMEILVAFVAGSLARRLINFIVKKARSKGVLTFFASFINIFFKVLGIIIALDQLGVSMNLIIGALSALGVGISLALKDNMASVASGLQILLTRPFKVGDYIKIGHHEGKVVSIEITFTTLLTPGNQTIIIPNNAVITRFVTNYSSELNRKIDIDFPCPANEADRYQMILIKAAQACSLVLNEPTPSVTIQSLDAAKAVLHLQCYTKHEDYAACYADLMKIIHEINVKTQSLSQPELASLFSKPAQQGEQETPQEQEDSLTPREKAVHFVQDLENTIKNKLASTAKDIEQDLPASLRPSTYQSGTHAESSSSAADNTLSESGNNADGPSEPVQSSILMDTPKNQDADQAAAVTADAVKTDSAAVSKTSAATGNPAAERSAATETSGAAEAAEAGIDNSKSQSEAESDSSKPASDPESVPKS